MQSTGRMIMMFMRGSIRGTRSGIWRKLLITSVICTLCLLFYYTHINSNTITHPDTSYLVAVSSLQSFTEISRQYTDVTSSNEASFNYSTNHHVLSSPSIVSNTQHTQSGTKSSKTLTNTIHKPVDSVREKNLVFKSRNKRYPELNRAPHVLLLYGTDGYRPSVEVKVFLESYRIPFIHVSLSKGRYLLYGQRDDDNDDIVMNQLKLIIIVSDISSILAQPYLEFCKEQHLPMIWTVLPPPHPGQVPQSSNNRLIPHLDTATLKSEAIIHVGLSKTYPFYYARPGAEGGKAPHGKLWTIFTMTTSYNTTKTNHIVTGQSSNSTVENNGIWKNIDSIYISHNYRTLVNVGYITMTSSQTAGGTSINGTLYEEKPVIIEDFGEFDGVRKILFGTPLKLWLSHLLLLDAVRVLCDGVELVRGGRERMVMVDIDDIFLAPQGTKMTKDDVQVCSVCVCVYVYVCV